MIFEFKNKTVLITGATRGIGKEIANQLAKLNANLILTGTKFEQVQKLNQERTSNNIEYFQLNPLEKDSLKNFLKDISKYKKIDGIVNNAGINRLNYINQSKMSDYDDMLNVNLRLPFELINIISKRMIINKFGRVVNIGSIFGVISKAKRSIYSTSKFGIHGLTVGASNDLAKHNILVNTVSPGFVLTDLTRQNLSDSEMKKITEEIPIRKMANPNYISNLVVFLLSNHNEYITGQNIVIDGGFTNT